MKTLKQITEEMSMPEWSDLILAKLEKDEKVEGAPRACGLKRLAMSYFGYPRSTRTEVVEPVRDNVNPRATVVVGLSFQVYSGTTVLPEENDYAVMITVDGAADVGKHNAQEMFSKHAVATAETIAEGRAYRKLLNIKTVMAEELDKQDKIMTIPIDIDGKELISDSQINFINMMCERNNINVENIVKNTQKVEKIGALLYENATSLFKILSGYQTDKASIPTELIGYNATWKNNF